jgi:hypothetical protein
MVLEKGNKIFAISFSDENVYILVLEIVNAKPNEGLIFRMRYLFYCRFFLYRPSPVNHLLF